MRYFKCNLLREKMGVEIIQRHCRWYNQANFLAIIQHDTAIDDCSIYDR